MLLVPENPSPTVSRAEGGCRPTRVFGIHEPRSHREEVGHVRDNLDEVVVGECIVVFLQTLVYGEQLDGA
jgi:hypothetical protein